MNVTKDQITAAVKALAAVGEAIKDLGSVAEGTLYATLMPLGYDLPTFNSMIERLLSTGLVKRENNLLIWIGDKPTSTQVAQTISDQIGRKAFLMMGAKNLLADTNSLTFSFKGCPFTNKIRVTLEPSDTYKVEFFKSRGVNCPLITEYDGVYADGLAQVIEQETGLRLSL